MFSKKWWVLRYTRSCALRQENRKYVKIMRFSFSSILINWHVNRKTLNHILILHYHVTTIINQEKRKERSKYFVDQLFVNCCEEEIKWWFRSMIVTSIKSTKTIPRIYLQVVGTRYEFKQIIDLFLIDYFWSKNTKCLEMKWLHAQKSMNPVKTSIIFLSFM